LEERQGKVLKRIVKFLIALAFRGVEKTTALFRKGHEKPGTCVVLMYHDITPQKYDRFIRQMKEMIQLARPVSACSIKSLQKGTHHVAVTFDDGFAETLELVQPVLAEMTIPATFFIPSAHLGKEADWISDMNRRRSVGPIITAERLKSLAEQNGVTIGSHGMNHRRLTELTDQDAWIELSESKKQLENITGQDVKIHGFPFGAYDDRHVAMAQEAGYDHVFTIDPTVAVGNVTDFVIGRVEVDPNDWLMEFKLKVLGSYRWHPYVSVLKKRFSQKYRKLKNGGREK
jgi:peptidoglycan/xylan/chitin deacetylase (PgdA/CDA1 family)